MQTLESLKSQIESTEDLHSVVKTMKTLAAVSIRQYEDAIDSIKTYDKTIELGFQILLKKNKAILDVFENDEKSKNGVIIIGSEQGMSGRFNETIVDFTESKLNELKIKNKNVIALGSRVSAILNSMGIKIDNIFPLPSSVKNISSVVQKLLSDIQTWRETENINDAYLFYNSKLTGSDYKPNFKPLLPININYLQTLMEKDWETNCLPQINIDDDKFLSALMREYLFVSIYRAIVESLAGENASRLAAMQSAEKNIEEREEELESQYNHLRQSAITSELLDIVGGTEALKN